jgi:plastocyanin
MKPKKDYFFTYIYVYIIFALLIPLFFVLTLYIKRGNPTVDVVVPVQVNKDLSENQQALLSLQNQGESVSPNIGLVENDTKASHNVEFLSTHIINASLTVNTGDTVIFINSAKYPVRVTGDNWGSVDYIPAGKNFSQKFDFVGEYKYSIGGLFGKIVVK